MVYENNFKFLREKKTDDYIYWNVIRSLMSTYSSYGGYKNTGYDFKFEHDINLFLKDSQEDVVEGIEIGKGWKIPRLEYLISQKYKYATDKDNPGGYLEYINQKFNHVI